MTRYITAFAAGIVLLAACKEMKDNSPLEEAMKDSIFKAIPEARYTRIEVREHQDVSVTIGSKNLFNGDEERRKEVVNQLTEMTIHYFEENNYLDDGVVLFVPNETTVPTDSDPKKEYDMHLDEKLEATK